MASNIIRLPAIGLLAVGLVACATPGTDAPTPEVEGNPEAGKCNADAVQGYVGDRADQSAGAAILKESGARSLRWGPLDAVWTMDFRQDRVNVQYDAALIIERITCG
jgi:hypothetical protein